MKIIAVLLPIFALSLFSTTGDVSAAQRQGPRPSGNAVYTDLVVHECEAEVNAKHLYGEFQVFVNKEGKIAYSGTPAKKIAFDRCMSQNGLHAEPVTYAKPH